MTSRRSTVALPRSTKSASTNCRCVGDHLQRRSKQEADSCSHRRFALDEVTLESSALTQSAVRPMPNCGNSLGPAPDWLWTERSQSGSARAASWARASTSDSLRSSAVVCPLRLSPLGDTASETPRVATTLMGLACHFRTNLIITASPSAPACDTCARGRSHQRANSLDQRSRSVGAART